MKPFIINGDDVIDPIFDPEAYVWRNRIDGRELTADEVELMGRDPGLRDITREEFLAAGGKTPGGKE